MLSLLILAALTLALLVMPLPVLAASNRYMNWTAVTFTPAGGGAVTIAGVTDVKLDRGGTVERFKGDAAVYPQCVAAPDRTRTMTVTSGDVDALMKIGQGTFGAVTATLGDAINGVVTAGGGKVYSMANCVVASNSAEGAHAKFGQAHIVFEGFDPTGATTEILTTTAL